MAVISAELEVFHVAEEQSESDMGGFLLAVRVVDEQLLQAGADLKEPAFRCWRVQAQHGGCLSLSVEPGLPGRAVLTKGLAGSNT